jgi:hypothetical protein
MVEKDEVVVLENVGGVDEDTHRLSGNPSWMLRTSTCNVTMTL